MQSARRRTVPRSWTHSAPWWPRSTLAAWTSGASSHSTPRLAGHIPGEHPTDAGLLSGDESGKRETERNPLGTRTGQGSVSLPGPGGVGRHWTTAQNPVDTKLCLQNGQPVAITPASVSLSIKWPCGGSCCGDCAGGTEALCSGTPAGRWAARRDSAEWCPWRAHKLSLGPHAVLPHTSYPGAIIPCTQESPAALAPTPSCLCRASPLPAGSATPCAPQLTTLWWLPPSSCPSFSLIPTSLHLHFLCLSVFPGPLHIPQAPMNGGPWRKLLESCSPPSSCPLLTGHPALLSFLSVWLMPWPYPAGSPAACRHPDCPGVPMTQPQLLAAGTHAPGNPHPGQQCLCGDLWTHGHPKRSRMEGCPLGT